MTHGYTHPLYRPAWVRFIVAVLLTADAWLVAMTYRSVFESGPWSRVEAYALGALIVLTAIVVLFRPNHFAMLMANGVAAGALAAFAILSILGRVVSGMGGFHPPLSPRQTELVYTALSVGLQLLLFYGLHILHGSVGWRSAVFTLGGLLAAGGVVLGNALVVERVAPVADVAMFGHRYAADSVMQAAVVRVEACAQEFARKNPHLGFPRDLDAIGPRGTHCVGSDVARANSAGVGVQYVARTHDKTGRVTDYFVTARGKVGSKREDRTVYGDSSGLIRLGRTGKSPQTLPVVNDHVRYARLVQACAELYRAQNPSRGYPKALTELQQLDGRVGEEMMKESGCNTLSLRKATAAHNVAGVRLAYTPTIEGSVVTDYVIETRPEGYGHSGIRSYRATSSGVVTYTREDRAATAKDPVSRANP